MNLSLSWLSADPINPETYARDVAAVRRRLMNLPAPKAIVVPEIRQPVPVAHQPRDFSHHMRSYKAWKEMNHPDVIPGEFIRLGCKAFHVEYEVLIARKSCRALSPVRTTLVRMTATRFPEMSLSMIGTLFNRHHTSILHILGRTSRAERVGFGCQQKGADG